MSNSLLGNHPKGLAFILSAPAGTGKTTLAHKLVKEFPCVKTSISYTTRQPRVGEVDGRDYFFISKEEFEKKIEQHEFLEYAKVFDHYYGTSKKALVNELEKGYHTVLVIDTQGAKKIIQDDFAAISIFVSPPSIDELKRRLVSRGTDSPESIKTRLSWAEQELEMASLYDYNIVNNDLNIAYEILRCIVIAEEHRNVRRKNGT